MKETFNFLVNPTEIIPSLNTVSSTYQPLSYIGNTINKKNSPKIVIYYLWFSRILEFKINRLTYQTFRMLLTCIFICSLFMYFLPTNVVFAEEIGLLSVLSSIYIFLFSNPLFIAKQVNSKCEQRT